MTSRPWNAALFAEIEEHFRQAYGPGFGRVSEIVEVAASPATSLIAFTGKVHPGLDSSPTYRLCLIDVEGGTPDEIDTGGNDAIHPRWSPDGTKILQRMVYKNITADEFDWSWESSSDGGKTWQVMWPIHYKRKP